MIPIGPILVIQKDFLILQRSNVNRLVIFVFVWWWRLSNGQVFK